jgi:hypothetical protein
MQPRKREGCFERNRPVNRLANPQWRSLCYLSAIFPVFVYRCLELCVYILDGFGNNICIQIFRFMYLTAVLRFRNIYIRKRSI